MDRCPICKSIKKYVAINPLNLKCKCINCGKIYEIKR